VHEEHHFLAAQCSIFLHEIGIALVAQDGSNKGSQVGHDNDSDEMNKWMNATNEWKVHNKNEKIEITSKGSIIMNWII
jgi:hypothetical protein